MSYVIQKQATVYDEIQDGVIYVVRTSQLEDVEYTLDLRNALKFDSYEKAERYFNHYGYTGNHKIKEI